MQLIVALLALVASKAATAAVVETALVHHPLLGRDYPDGVIVTAIDPEDIPEGIRNGTISGEIKSTRDLAKRDPGVYLCTDAYWQGYCVHISTPAYVCVPLAGDLNDRVSSVGPDSTVGNCRFHFNAGCPENACDHFDVRHPGYDNLDNVPSVCGYNAPNDKISSYQCFN